MRASTGPASVSQVRAFCPWLLPWSVFHAPWSLTLTLARALPAHSSWHRRSWPGEDTWAVALKQETGLGDLV